MAHHSNHQTNGHGGASGHHEGIDVKGALLIGAALIVLTVITVAVAGVDLGRFNFLVAMFVATIKGLLVALFFMNLKFDRKENAIIFGTSFLFLVIFIVLTGADLFFRGDVYVKGPLVAESKSKLVNGWVSTPKLVAGGHEIFKVQCASCHGDLGQGNGLASAGLNPKPRNFTQAQGWKNGRKPSQVFKTLKEGLGGMPSFSSLPSDDRWMVAHYILSLGPAAEADTPGDLAKIGIDPSKGGEASEGSTEISIDLAIDRIAVE